MAAQEAISLRYWYRQKYNLSLHDPRYEQITDEEIALEYETELAAEGKQLNDCSKCGASTHQDECPVCRATVSGDEVIDDAFSRIASGEKMSPEKLDALLRGQEWEEI